MTYCQTCNQTGANCGPVQSDTRVAPISPPTQKCPENTVLVPNGNCLPLTNIPEDQQQATKQPSDNKPSKPNLPKGGSVLEQPQTGESSLQIR